MPDASAETRFIEALLADETLFDRLAAAHPIYLRFAKVLQREDTAGRLTIADVANMVGLPVASVIAVVRGQAGREEGADGSPPERLPEGRPAWADRPGQDIRRFDARPLLEDGHEPLPNLLSFAESAPREAMLVIDATFHPQPLRRLFEGRGYQSGAEPLGTDHWRVYFRRAEAADRAAME